MGTNKLRSFSIADWLANASLRMEFAIRSRAFASKPTIEKIFSLLVPRAHYTLIVGSTCTYLSLVNWAAISLGIKLL